MPIQYKYRFTVFTPVYNGEKTLSRVHKSLCNQTFKDFEWIIVDDGSSDNTEEIVHKFMSSSNFSIQYFKQENQHKYSTYPIAIQNAKGEFLLTLDSDDACIPKALEIFDSIYRKIPEEERQNFSGVTGTVTSEDGVPRSPENDSYLDSNSAEYFFKYKNFEERWGFQKTDVLKELDFKRNYFNKGYIPEGLIWLSIAKLGYKTRFFNKPLRIYYEDQEDTITNTSLNIKNAYGICEYYKFVLNNFANYFFNYPSFFIGAILRYNYYSQYAVEHSKGFSAFKNPFFKLIHILSYPATPLMNKFLKTK